MYLFRERLKRTCYLIISGYSFRDKGINTAILEWLYYDQNHRIVVVHRNPEGLIINARGAIQIAFKNFEANFSIVKKYIDNTEHSADLDEVLEKIAKDTNMSGAQGS